MARTSKRVQAVKPSPTLAANTRAKELIAAGEDVINLGAGEPDFDSPDEAKAAGIEAIEANLTRYTPVAGLLHLREAIVAKLRDDQDLSYEPTQVLVSMGAKHSLANFFQAVLDPGDEVIIPAPYWVSYPAQVELAGGSPVVVETDHKTDFVPDPKAVEEKVTDQTKVLLINSPSNPTGAGYPREVIEALVRIAIENDLLICSDEIYRNLVYNDFQPASPASISGGAKDRTILINGVSKTYAMTGWRIGWAVGPAEIINAMTTIQSQGTSGAPGMCQKAAQAALLTPPDVVETMRSAFEVRMRLVVDGLRAIPNVECPEPKGAFYVFPYFGAYYKGEISDSVKMQSYLLETAGVSLVAGAPFGADGHLRLSFAISTDELEDALGRIANALAKIS